MSSTNTQNKSRDNHYVPQWYQRGFMPDPKSKLWYLNLQPDKILRPDGKEKYHRDLYQNFPSQCFSQVDLYTTFFGPFANDEIEKKLFGNIDDLGSKSVRAFLGKNISEWHENFTSFFSYIDMQKIRTPKGLDWLAEHYPKLDQNSLMREMQAIRHLHATIWTEGVREIVSAEKSKIKFIVSDHPVTIYNCCLPPGSDKSIYPNDPSITLKGTQTIFPLDMNHCLILTNYEYARNKGNTDPLEKRTNPIHFRDSLVRIDAFIRTREFMDEEVDKINYLIKSRAKRFVAASEREWLYPEKRVNPSWEDLRDLLLPPKDELWKFGGEMYVSYNDGSVSYQDAFGRTTPHNEYLFKEPPKNIGVNEICGCGSGKKYKKCCKNIPTHLRRTWAELSIRERNLTLLNGIHHILGLKAGKTWEDVRRELSDDQVRDIHELYAHLWPPETNIIDLLPKPDGSLRAVYTGIVDPRLISAFATGFVLFVDELIIQSPFPYAPRMNPEYSPVSSPHSFKQQTLKNLFLILSLENYIAAGFINFIPDPCFFNSHLQKQMMAMAEARGKRFPPKNHQNDEVFMAMQKDDVKRTMSLLPIDVQRRQYKKASPHLSDEDLEKLISYVSELKEEDPLALLQEGVFDKGDGGQLTLISLVPNFEMSLFLAQATGSILVTDNDYRWSEIRNVPVSTAPCAWDKLCEKISAISFPINRDLESTFGLRLDGKMVNFRNVFREFNNLISSQSAVIPEQKINQLESRLSVAFDSLEKELGDELMYCIKALFLTYAPVGGIVDTSVQRLLLSAGAEYAAKCVPLTVYFEGVRTEEGRIL